MPASSILMSFDDCETDGLSNSYCTNFFYYTNIRKSSIYIRGGSRIDCRGGGLSIPCALALAKFYVLRPLLTSFLRW